MSKSSKSPKYVICPKRRHCGSGRVGDCPHVGKHRRTSDCREDVCGMTGHEKTRCIPYVRSPHKGGK